MIVYKKQPLQVCFFKSYSTFWWCFVIFCQWHLLQRYDAIVLKNHWSLPTKKNGFRAAQLKVVRRREWLGGLFIDSQSWGSEKSETWPSQKFLCLFFWLLKICQVFELGDVVTASYKLYFYERCDCAEMCSLWHICNYCSEDAGTRNMDLHNAELLVGVWLYFIHNSYCITCDNERYVLKG